MHVGTQYPIRSDTDYEVLAQLGVNHINGYPPGPPEKAGFPKGYIWTWCRS